MSQIALPDRFIATFTLLAGTTAELHTLPTCALALVGRRAQRLNELGSDRFCRGLLAGVALSRGEWDSLTTAARHALSLDPSASLDSIMRAVSIFDTCSTETLLRLLPDVFDQRSDRSL